MAHTNVINLFLYLARVTDVCMPVLVIRRDLLAEAVSQVTHL